MRADKGVLWTIVQQEMLQLTLALTHLRYGGEALEMDLEHALFDSLQKHALADNDALSYALSYTCGMIKIEAASSSSHMGKVVRGSLGREHLTRYIARFFERGVSQHTRMKQQFDGCGVPSLALPAFILPSGDDQHEIEAGLDRTRLD